MTGITTDGIEIDRDVAASPAAVFAAWTTPRHFAQWFGGKAGQVPLDGLDFTAQPGRPWAAQMILPDGNTIDWAGGFVEVTPDERFVFTITDRPTAPSQATIVVELAPIASGTRMHFTQETPGFSPDEQKDVLAGWQSFLDELEEIATA